MTDWFKFTNKADDPKVATLDVLGIIGGWIAQIFDFEGVVTAKPFLEALDRIPASVETIRTRINSPGGDAMAGVTIANALRQHRARVEVVIEGMAGSAASVIAMAGDEVLMADGSLMMIHRPSAEADGTVDDLRVAVSALDRLESSLVTIYQWHSKLSPDAIKAKLSARTYMTADEAISDGFATGKVPGLKATALLSPDIVARLGEMPEKYRPLVEALIDQRETPTVKNEASVSASEPPAAKKDESSQPATETPKTDESAEPEPDPEKTPPVVPVASATTPVASVTMPAITASTSPSPQPEAKATPQPAAPLAVIRACKEAGFPEMADDLLNLPIEQVTAKLGEAKAAKKASETRATEIRAMCASASKSPAVAAKLAALADVYIRSAMTQKEVGEALTIITAAQDVVEIDAHLPPETPKPKAHVIDTAKIYARANYRNGG